MLDNQGNRIRDRVFSAWGQITSDTNPTVFFPFAFTGREYDPESGLYYYRARYYHAATGRFISEDPLGFSAGDTTLSRYVFNSPTNFTDPTGLFLFPTAVPHFPRYGPGELLYVPLFDHFATGYLNEKSVAALPTEEDRIRWLDQDANSGDFTPALIYVWTAEDMKAWFAAEQRYMDAELRNQFMQALENLAKLTQNDDKARDLVRSYVNGFRERKLPKEYKDLLGALTAFAQISLKVAKLHDQAHKAAIKDYNQRHPYGPKLKSVEYHYEPGPKAKPKATKVTFEDGVAITFRTDDQGRLVDQEIDARKARRSKVEDALRETFTLSHDSITKIMDQKKWITKGYFPSETYKRGQSDDEQP